MKTITFVFLLLISTLSFAGMSLYKADFSQLTGWEKDDQTQALVAFQQSCREILKRNPATSFIVPTSKWQAACRVANKINHPDFKTARRFFETSFKPYFLAENNYAGGLFTGYYLPLIHGNLKATKRFPVPVHGLPDDLVKINLGSFDSAMTGKFRVGQVKKNKLFPYPARSEIKHTHNVLLWADNPIDVYFAQIQGSSLVQLPNKKRFLIGYAGGNGHKYTAIGKVLVERGELQKEDVSMQSIRDWLLKHPNQVNELLNQNDSYVFFQILKDNYPLGTQGVPLTPQRSLAVDNRYIPFGAPIWVKTTIPAYPSDCRVAKGAPCNDAPFRKLLIAQDTGGAIKGVVRGDIYWGTGSKAEFIAGHMNQSGQSWILLPR